MDRRVRSRSRSFLEDAADVGFDCLSVTISRIAISGLDSSSARSWRTSVLREFGQPVGSDLLVVLYELADEASCDGGGEERVAGRVMM